MSNVTRCWWIRHAPVVDNGGLVYGQSDIAADLSDRAPYQSLARFLPAGAVWVASHLRRTHQTAGAIGDAGLDVPELIVEPDLAEQDLGDWQGQPRDEVFARYGEWHKLWVAPATTAAPGGESFADLIDRMVPAVERLVRDHRGRDIVIVAHGGTIRAALAHALGLAPATALAFTIDNLSLTRLDYIKPANREQGVWRVVSVNRIPG